MTAMNWSLHPKQLLLFCDTLATDGSDHLPRGLTTKVFVLGHLNAVICGAGLANAVSEFYGHVVANMVVKDIKHLDEFAPDIIAGIFERLIEPLPPSSDKQPTATIYSFGWIQEEERLGGFAYRSTNDFVSERLGYGTCVKPPTNDLSIVEQITSLEGFIELMITQQAEDRCKARKDRLGIGGDILLYSIEVGESSAVTLQVRSIATLPHLSSDWDIILAKLPVNANHPLTKLVLESAP